MLKDYFQWQQYQWSLHYPTIDNQVFQAAHLFEHLISRWLFMQHTIVISGTTSKNQLTVTFLCQTEIPLHKQQIWQQIESLCLDGDVAELEKKTIQSEQPCLNSEIRNTWQDINISKILQNFAATYQQAHWQTSNEPYLTTSSEFFLDHQLQTPDSKYTRAVQKLFTEAESFVANPQTPPKSWQNMTARIHYASSVFPGTGAATIQRAQLDIVCYGASLYASSFQDHIRNNSNIYSVILSQIPILENTVLLMFVSPFIREQKPQTMEIVHNALDTLLDSEDLELLCYRGRLLYFRFLEQLLTNPKDYALFHEMWQRYAEQPLPQWLQKICQLQPSDIEQGVREIKSRLYEQAWDYAPQDLQLCYTRV